MFVEPGKVDCSKCGQWLFTILENEEDERAEVFPPVPLLVRVVRQRLVGQIPCPRCGNVEERRVSGTATPLPPAFVHVIASTREDSWGVNRIVFEHAGLQALTIDGCLSPPVEAFKANIARLDRLGSSSVLAIGLTHLQGIRYYTYTEIENLNQDVPPARLIENYLRQTALYLRLDEKLRAQAIDYGKDQLKLWLLHHRELQTGVETIFSSQLVALWTAIEVLSLDLWEAALNHHPKILADLAGASKRIKSGSEGDAPERMDKNESREIALSEINRVTRGGYDLSDKMGDLLKAKFNFSTLQGIRSAYSVAFSMHYTNVDKAIGSDALDAASIARNVLVHKAGVADDEYVRKAKRTDLPRLALGESFPLNGQITAKIVNDALEACIKLIKAVDAWLKAH